MLETLLAALVGGLLVTAGVCIGRVTMPRHETGKATASHRVVTEEPGVTANSDASLYLREKELDETRQTVENLAQMMHLGPQAFAEASEEELERDGVEL